MELFDNPHKKYLDHGHVVLLDVMGSDEDIEYAARMSYANGTRTVSQTQSLLDFLMRHEHTSPFEMVEIKFQIKMPIFVMRQLVRHRTASLNEMSLRYSKATDEFYVPALSRMNTQSSSNKQCSSEELIDWPAETRNLISVFNENAFDGYTALLDSGLSREIARGILPVNGYTEVVWKIDLKNLMHFLKLRLHSHAQKEIQWLAQAMYDLLKETGKFDLTLDAFERYILNASKMSSEEMKILQFVFKSVDKEDIQEIMKLTGAKLSAREINELKEKLNVE
jgi:thymidylate synthase, flavin-dependent|nr:MAG TPA: FAD-dependent thymidylate synthase [Caudoviricetes sp.]